LHTHQFTIQKSVRYFTIGTADAHRKHLWVCLHGYGQTGEWFAKHFEKFASKHRLFLIPEAPHRFYTEGTAGRIGASWMTREDRLNDIADQFHYLENLLTQIKQNVGADCKIHVLGFSQGVATALRWLDKTNHNISSIVCWAGTFPPDIDYHLNQNRFAQLRIFGVFGDEDEFIPTEKAHELIDQLQAQNIAISPLFYNGKHRLYADLLGEIIMTCED